LLLSKAQIAALDKAKVAKKVTKSDGLASTIAVLKDEFALLEGNKVTLA
jgi:hypothetical protein